MGKFNVNDRVRVINGSCSGQVGTVKSVEGSTQYRVKLDTLDADGSYCEYELEHAIGLISEEIRSRIDRLEKNDIVARCYYATAVLMFVSTVLIIVFQFVWLLYKEW